MPGRGAEIQDVINDSIGALIGIISFVILYKIIEVTRNKLSETNHSSEKNYGGI